jgi:hypothetical protein
VARAFPTGAAQAKACGYQMQIQFCKRLENLFPIQVLKSPPNYPSLKKMGELKEIADKVLFEKREFRGI